VVKTHFNYAINFATLYLFYYKLGPVKLLEFWKADYKNVYVDTSSCQGWDKNLCEQNWDLCPCCAHVTVSVAARTGRCGGRVNYEGCGKWLSHRSAQSFQVTDIPNFGIDALERKSFKVNLRISQRWLWRVPSSETWCRIVGHRKHSFCVQGQRVNQESNKKWCVSFFLATKWLIFSPWICDSMFIRKVCERLWRYKASYHRQLKKINSMA
jgi:hypothetical protein